MKTILELQRFLNRPYPLKHYNFQPDDKVHLLYVSPKLNATGYYRAIAPALELNKTKTHKAIITSINQNDFAKRFDNQFHHLDEILVKWADYVIFPPTMGDLRYLTKAIQMINPQVQLFMDMDKNYFHQKASSKLTALDLEQFRSNLLEMDGITVANERLGRNLKKQIHPQKTKSTICHIPSLVSQFAYEDLTPLRKNETDTIRIGFIKPDLEELRATKALLLEVNDSHKAIKWVYFGPNKASKKIKEDLDGFDIECHNTVHFKDYFKALEALKLDLVLIPDTNKQRYEQLEMELSVFKIPVLYIGSQSKDSAHPNEKTPLELSFENKLAMVIELIENDALREEVGRNNLKKTWKLKGYSQKNREIFCNIFI